MDRVVIPFEIAGRRIGPGEPCFVIAEAGVNHNGDLTLAKRLVDAAADAGADAVKFQTFHSERLVSPLAPKAEYQRRTTDNAESQLDMVRKLELSHDAHRELFTHCAVRGILFLSTPFDDDSADFLDALGVAAFKVGSGELTNWPFLQYVASKGKPVILSTGMSALAEVEDGVRAMRQIGELDLALLHCVSCYPADPGDVNLRAMKTLADTFHVPIGFSDHTDGLEVALAAVALGASILEKHVTLDSNLPGPDHQASLEPNQLAEMVRGIRIVERAMGDGVKRPAPSERPIADVARRSIVARVDILSGTVLTRELVDFRRPGTGLPPNRVAEILGRQAICDIAAGTVLVPEQIR